MTNIWQIIIFSHETNIQYSLVLKMFKFYGFLLYNNYTFKFAMLLTYNTVAKVKSLGKR